MESIILIVYAITVSALTVIFYNKIFDKKIKDRDHKIQELQSQVELLTEMQFEEFVGGKKE